MQKEFDLVVFGATGFTGRLVAEYLQGHAAGGADRQAGRAPLRWEFPFKVQSSWRNVIGKMHFYGSPVKMHL